MADPVSLGVTLALNAASYALTASQEIEGPRLQNLDVTQSDYGTPHNYYLGTVKLNTWVMFAEPIREQQRRRKTKGGKYNDYTYYGTFAVAVALQQSDAILAIYFDEHFVYNATGVGPVSPFSIADAGAITDYMRIYLGTSTQDQDPRIQATIEAALGAGTCPAYRGLTYIVFEDLPLEKLGNRLPQVKVVATTNGGPAYPYSQYDAVLNEAMAGGHFGVSLDGSMFIWANGTDYEIWDVYSQTPMVSGTLPGNVVNSIVSAGIGNIGFAQDGAMFMLMDYPSPIFNTQVYRFGPEGTGGALGPSDSFYAASFLKVLKSAWHEYICITRYATNGGWFSRFQRDSVTGNIVYTTTFIDPSLISGIGVNAIIRDFFVDLDGELWAVGSNGGLAADEICFIHILPTDGMTGFVVTVPGVAASTEGDLYAWHYRDANVDHYVCFRGDATGDPWFCVDATTHLVTISSNTLPVASIPGIYLVKPGASSYYTEQAQISSADLSLIRSWDLDTWLAGQGGILPGVYDPINNAIFKRAGSGTVGWFYLDRATGGGVQLSDVIDAIALQCGLDPADYDASDCDQDIVGYAWVQGQGKTIIEPLLDYYDSEARSHDFSLEFRKRTGTSLATIPVADMGAGRDGKAARYTVSRVLDTDLPRRATVTFSDPYIGREPNTAIAQRMAANVDSSREISLDMSTMVDEPVDARFAVDRWLRRQWTANESYELSLTREYSKLEPGDVYVLDLDNLQKTARLEKITFQADGVFSTRWTRDGGTIPAAAAQPGAPADGVVTPTIPTFPPSRGFVLDIPLVADVDDGIITYVAAGPYSSSTSWTGATFQESLDLGVAYDSFYDAVISADEATWGTASGALAAALTSVWDRASTLSVYVQNGSLTSATELEVMNGANRALIGDEIVGFATATLTAPNTYTLSNFLRGRRGTEQHVATHAAGDRFLMLDAITRHAHGASDVGTDLYVKPSTTGSFSSAGFPIVLTYTGASAKPYSPAHLEVTDSAGDKVITWIRRTRIGGDQVYGSTPPLGEGSEAYVVQILNGSGTVIRTISGLSSPTATYTAAQQSSDGNAGVTARVMQVSTTVGAGFPSDVALAA